MKLLTGKTPWTPVFLLGLGIANHAQAGAQLSLQDFLNQVQNQNTGVKGSSLSGAASEQRSVEASLVTAPYLYATFETKSDARISPFSFLQYDSLATNVFSMGVSQSYDFGLQAKLHYDIVSVQYLNPVTANLPAGFASVFANPFNNATPVLELSQSLWSNGFGTTTRASKTLIEAQDLASSHLNRFQAKSALVSAELAYWRLVAARQIIEVQNQAIDRARKIYEWNQKRANLHLADEADEIQAQALVESRGLDVIAAQNEERSAARAFNSARNIESAEVQEALARLEINDLSQIEIPKRAEMREDVKAAKETARATEANAVVQTEKNQPTFDVYGSLAFNGQPRNYFSDPYNGTVNLAQSLGLSVQPNRPTYNVGVKFTLPLNFGTVSQTQDAWRQEKAAAQLTYERKLFEQEQTWKELVQNLADTSQHLKLSQQLELTQKRKLEAEKDRLHKGRSTTYQVLLFEQDYLYSQLGRIKDQISLLTTLAQMNLFGESK